MLNTKSKILSALGEFNITTPINPDGVFVLHEDVNPCADHDGWEMIFNESPFYDGASTICVNRESGTLVLSYDSTDCRYREYLVFGGISEFSSTSEDFVLDSIEHSLWYRKDGDVEYTEYLCDHLVRDMEFDD